MRRYWKRYLLLIALIAILVYVGWRMYEDYELSAYPQRVADSIPVPPGAQVTRVYVPLVDGRRTPLPR